MTESVILTLVTHKKAQLDLPDHEQQIVSINHHLSLSNQKAEESGQRYIKSREYTSKEIFHRAYNYNVGSPSQLLLRLLLNCLHAHVSVSLSPSQPVKAMAEAMLLGGGGRGFNH